MVELSASSTRNLFSFFVVDWGDFGEVGNISRLHGIIGFGDGAMVVKFFVPDVVFWTLSKDVISLASGAFLIFVFDDDRVGCRFSKCFDGGVKRVDGCCPRWRRSGMRRRGLVYDDGIVRVDCI